MDTKDCLYEDFENWARKHGWLLIHKDERRAEWIAPSGEAVIAILSADGKVKWIDRTYR